MPINSSVFPALSCTSLKVLDLTLRSLIHFELIFVQDERHVLPGGGWYQWEEGGSGEKVWEDEYSANTVYKCM
jgi:hypothetical protein